MIKLDLIEHISFDPKYTYMYYACVPYYPSGVELRVNDVAIFAQPESDGRVEIYTNIHEPDVYFIGPLKIT
jgi:hypothetical protein